MVRTNFDVPTQRAERSRWSFLFLPLSGVLGAWFAFIFHVTYDFSNPTGIAISKRDLAFIGALFTKVPRNFGLFLFLLVFLGSAIGPGDWLLQFLRLDWRDEAERALFALATGLILFTFVILGVGSIGRLQRRVCGALLVGALVMTALHAVGVYRRIRTRRASAAAVSARLQGGWKTLYGVVLGLALAFALYLALLGALSPEFNYDARWYHLGAANSYAQHEDFYNIVKETRLAAAAVDPYQTALYAALIKLDGLIAAKVLHWGDALLTALLLIYFCYAHFRSTRMGILAALIFISTPVVTWSATGGSNDLQLSLYILLSIHAFLRWREQSRSPRWLIILGIMSGYALGSKLFGLYSALILLGGVVIVGYWSFRKQDAPAAIARRLAVSLILTGSAIVFCCLPWLIRSYIQTGNPVFPLFNNIFRSPYWNNYAEQSLRLAYQTLDRNQSLLSLFKVPWQAITGNNRYRAIFGPLFFLNMPICIALALFSRERTRDVFRMLGIYLTVWVLLWFASGALELRYALSVLPVMAVLVTYPVMVQWWPGWSGRLFQVGLGAIMLITIILNYQPLVPYQRMGNLPTAFGHAYIPWTYLYHGLPEEQVDSLSLPMIRYMNTQLSPATDLVYDFGEGLILDDAYSNITIFNGGGYDGPYGMHEWDLFSADAIEHFHQQHITHLAVSQEYNLALKRFPLWPYLREIYRTPDASGLLYQVDYNAVVGNQPVATEGPTVIDDATFSTGWLPGAAVRDGYLVQYMEQDGQIFVVTNKAGTVVVNFTAIPVFKPLTLEVRVNGRLVTTTQLGTVGSAQKVTIEQVPMRQGENMLTLHAVEGCVRPSDFSSSPDTRCFSITVQQVAVMVP